MSSGPEHYQEAERLMDDARAAHADRDEQSAGYYLAEAQVHATLALAAAYAIPNAGQMPTLDCEAWEDAAGEEAAFQIRAAVHAAEAVSDVD